MRNIFKVALLLTGVSITYLSYKTLRNDNSISPMLKVFNGNLRNYTLCKINSHSTKHENFYKLTSFNSSEHYFDKISKNSSNIFFIESSCKEEIRLRNLCSFESYALHNKKSNIFVLFFVPHLEDNLGILKRLLSYYKNIHPFFAQIDQIVTDTPLRDFFESGKWLKNEDFATYLSDLLRPCLLWKYGGIYTDTDMICLRDLSSLGNAIGFENPKMLNSAFLKLEKKHPFLDNLLNYLKSNFQGYSWGANGPKAATKTMQKMCSIKDFASWRNVTKDRCSCKNICIHEQRSFYPILWHKVHKFFETPYSSEYAAMLNGTYTFHFNNHATKSLTIKLGNGTAFEKLVKDNCPVVYKIAVKKVSYF